MFIPRLYYPHEFDCPGTIAFDKEKSHYLATVLRLQKNDPIIIFNGQGGEYHAKIEVNKKQIFANILAFDNVQREAALAIHLGQGLARGDRMDFVIQKATELGVASITPLFTKQSAVKLDPLRASKRLEHWQNIAISAAEQSGRTKVPTIAMPLSLFDWAKLPFEGASILFEPQSSTSLKTLLPPKAVRLAIGPESGWHEQEITIMLAQQFIATMLGPRILRTETASITAISLIQGLFGDLG
ncbi:MAG: 16S rRNA (uracil(1498)-N(3))-methyltransferase [Proteobacteria bacterium]|nr:16S rRNA (uracil(1498)-N(3))-methyltransferase [Pseudomonadota bacterium]